MIESKDADAEATRRVSRALGLADDTVVCRECGEALGQITASHLSMHGLKMDEYRREYPTAPLQSPVVKRKSGVGDRHSEDTRRLIGDRIRRLHEEGHYDGA